ncbi:MAG: hypothetical protein LBN27_11870 [Prevotellaceae bacterium]|jgi:hypothetical protein|nr:hypothetical protein [Prevotellaceae bacterium]
MKKISVLTLFLIAILNINAQNVVSKRLVKMNILLQNQTVSFKYNGKNEVVSIDEPKRKCKYTLSYNPDGSLKQVKKNISSILKIEYTYSYDKEKILINEKRSGSQNRVSNDSISLVDKSTFEIYSSYNRKTDKFVYDNNNNLIENVYFYGNSNKETSVYKYNNDISPLLYTQSIPIWFWISDFSLTIDWVEGLAGKNTVKHITREKVDADGNQMYAVEREYLNMPMPTEGNKLSEVDYTYEYDNDGYPIKQYKNGKLIREFFYETFK